MKRLLLVSATRLPEERFWSESLLGRSLRAFPEELRPELALTFQNDGPSALGLPVIYNQALDLCPPGRNLVFVHDDVYLHDPQLELQVHWGLCDHDLIGIAGSLGAPLDAVSWGLHFDQALQYGGWMRGPGFEQVRLSGAVSHLPLDRAAADAARRGGGAPPIQLSVYGEGGKDCTLLDGVLIAVNADSVNNARVRFDEQFAFHLYDLDFCRSARNASLFARTWPLLVTHASGGAFGTASWANAARQYRRKWAALDLLRQRDQSRAERTPARSALP